VLFSEPKIPQSCTSRNTRTAAQRVSVLFSEPKIPQSALEGASLMASFQVSVLFSEPKIPQCVDKFIRHSSRLRFSALQRAENSSIWLNHAQPVKTASVSVLFSEPKIPQSKSRENLENWVLTTFQCSSASRKFLNFCGDDAADGVNDVSVLFSEPKIPQFG